MTKIKSCYHSSTWKLDPSSCKSEPKVFTSLLGKLWFRYSAFTRLSSTRSVIMNKENATTARVEGPAGRITRARSKALGIAGGTCSSRTSFKQDQKRPHRVASKRAASDENRTSNLQHKKRAVLKDVSNVSSDQIYMNCANKGKVQIAKKASKGIKGDSREIQSRNNDSHSKLADDLSKITMVAAQETGLPTVSMGEKPVEQKMCENRREEKETNEKLGVLDDHGFVDIDKDKKNPLLCGLYAPEIYNNIRVAEHTERPSTDYMEQMQRDINPSMRGILIDWLVEVSEEYKLVPDTLYLTVNLIDRFLSHNQVEKQRLQLLGVSCMLIASKYEEICAPRVEEFCFITDNTYTREEVLKMESEVLNFLHFHLSMPTTKTFLRRFIQAAQASYKAPSVELELLANYLAELTLLEYQFLKFLPSRIAASAVLLARWTLRHSDDPWNWTLEHYTNYNASELKTTVLALEDLQRNTKGCSLNAIREKYKQPKFKCVATLSSREGASNMLFSR